MTAKTKCENCGLKEVDGIISIGGKELKSCSPECMGTLLEKYKSDKQTIPIQQRNTAKEKHKQNKGFPYKKTRLRT